MIHATRPEICMCDEEPGTRFCGHCGGVAPLGPLHTLYAHVRRNAHSHRTTAKKAAQRNALRGLPPPQRAEARAAKWEGWADALGRVVFRSEDVPHERDGASAEPVVD